MEPDAISIVCRDPVIINHWDHLGHHVWYDNIRLKSTVFSTVLYITPNWKPDMNDREWFRSITSPASDIRSDLQFERRNWVPDGEGRAQLSRWRREYFTAEGTLLTEPETLKQEKNRRNITIHIFLSGGRYCAEWRRMLQQWDFQCGHSHINNKSGRIWMLFDFSDHSRKPPLHRVCATATVRRPITLSAYVLQR